MTKIFISYRRSDSAAEAGRIYEKLTDAFDEDEIIKDVDSFPMGEDFRTAITEGVIACDVMLVLIGEDWLSVTNDKGERRLDDPDDFVRFEVDLALRRSKTVVIPVILGKASPPAEDALPASLRELAYKNAAFVRHDPDFENDMKRLIRYIRGNRPDLRLVGILVAVVALLALLVAGFIFLPPMFNRGTEGTNLADNPNSTSAPYDSAVQSARNFVGSRNSDWVPYIHDFEDGVSMALVPEGCFTIGSTPEQIEFMSGVLDLERRWEEDEQPAERICLDAFWIDVNEVSQADFSRLSEIYNLSASSGDNLPVENVSWIEAHDYCEQQGKYLPTEAEWEYAARGLENLIYPWGNEFDGSLLSYCDETCVYGWRDAAHNDGYETTAPVNFFTEGASWVGALNMSGNVWEWTSSLFRAYPYSETSESAEDRRLSRTLRGGSWYEDAGSLRSAVRTGQAPAFYNSNLGFRCARAIED